MVDREDKINRPRPDAPSEDKVVRPRGGTDLIPAREETPARPVKEEAPARPEREAPPVRAEQKEADLRAERDGGETNGGDDPPPRKAERPPATGGGGETSTTETKQPIGDRPPTADKVPSPARAETRGLTTRAEISKEFTLKFDAERFEDIHARPVKSVVVGQDPPAGEFVPAGTPINLSFTFKDSLPLDSFKDVDNALTDKFQTVGEVLSDLSRNDQTSKDASAVFEKEEARDYRDLTPADKTRVDKFIKERTGVDPAADAERARGIFNDMKFMHNL